MSASNQMELSALGVAIAARLAQLGIVLPAPGVARGSYVPWVISGKQVYIAGQGPRLDGQMMYAGQVGVDLSVDEGRQAARICALNLIAQIGAACGGDLGRVVRIVRLAGVVNSGAGFAQHSAVLDGASDLMRQVFLERGLHVRMATGASSLPSNMAVEIEAVVEID